MGDTREKPVGTGEHPYIWLRYTTQFTTGGRTHTIEMGIPMPLGASAETREQLIREAEAGMDQLSRHVENRVTQMLQRSARPQGVTSSPQPSASSLSRPPGSSSFATPPSSSSPAPMRVGTNTSPPHRPPDSVAPSVGATPGTPQGQALGLQATTQSAAMQGEGMQPPAVTSARPNTTVGASMPLSPNMPGEASGNMKLSQFMQYIREAWGLTPKQAMELLNVKTLNGLNYREALRQLQPLVEGEGSTSTSQQGGAKEGGAIKRAPTAPTPLSSASMRPNVGPQSGASSERSSTPHGEVKGSTGPSKIPIIPISSGMVRDVQNVYRFDEEDDKELELDEENEDSEQQQIMARIKLDELKEVRGSSVASPARLTVLQNVTNSQISETQLHQLIRAAWGATSLKKLKVDQVEALISWAKEDFFVDEVEAVLALIAEEDSYARSDW